MSMDRVSSTVKARSRATRPTTRPRTTAGVRPDRRAGPREILDRRALEAYLARATILLRRHRGLLDRLDAALGDGDHGDNMVVGFESALRSLPEAAPRDLGGLVRAVGRALVASVGGGSGALYGTAFLEAGFTLGPITRLSPGAIADALDAGVRGLARRGRCAVGDKTILDALAPAARAFRASVEADEPLDAAARHAAWAAHAGMRATVPLVARRGLAVRLGDRSRGHQDPGATSCFLLIRAMLPPRKTGRHQPWLPLLVGATLVGATG
ncbi:MAG: dihydroxyacetone kinase subunit DhaL [Candidatus Limnocylindrales bacterium]